jgi:dihydroorotate dehydrogenase (NAD+) catalytic subunit
MSTLLKITLSKLELESPFILASGILGVSYSSMKQISDAGAGAVTTKSIGPIPRKGYKNPSVLEIIPNSFINSVGLGNPGIDDFISEIQELKQNQITTIVSVFGDSIDSYIEVAVKAQNAGADAIELNISCPHAEIASICQDKNITYDYVSTVKEKIDIPLFVKLSPNVTDICEIALSAEKAGADAITAINTVNAMAIDVESQRPILSHGSGGLSGKAIHPIAVKKVYDLYKVLKIPIIGCGGVFTWEDAIEIFLAGATAVQIGSALYQDYNILKKIVEGTIKYLNNHNYKSVSEIIGNAHNFQLQEAPDY